MIGHKKNLCLLFAFLLMFSLTACITEEPEKLYITTSDIEPVPLDDSKQNTLLTDTPSHISKIFNENFIVDADVDMPNIQNADILFAKYMRFDEQALLSAFYNKKTPDKEINPADNIISYQDDSSYMVIANEYVLYRSEDFEYVKFPTDSLIAKNDFFSFGKKFDEVYVQENLNFMTRTDAFETASNILEQLSIEITDNAEIYAIDYQTMQSQQEERIQENIDIQEKMGVSPIQDPTDGYRIKKSYSQDDDFYILYFTMVQNQIPITQKSYNIMAGERTLYGSTVRVSLSQKGIIELDCSGIYQSQGIAESSAALISVEEAIQNAYEIHNAIISTDKVIIKAIDLEYVPVAYNENYDEVKLIPSWSMTLTYENDGSAKGEKVAAKSSVVTRMIFINAVTGEEIK